MSRRIDRGSTYFPLPDNWREVTGGDTIVVFRSVTESQRPNYAFDTIRFPFCILRSLVFKVQCTCDSSERVSVHGSNCLPSGKSAGLLITV